MDLLSSFSRVWVSISNEVFMEGLFCLSLGSMLFGFKWGESIILDRNVFLGNWYLSCTYRIWLS